MLETLLSFNTLSIVAVAAASGLVGSFALMRRMTLAADAISHIALPGLGLAFLFHINPIIGAAATMLLGAVLVWSIERKSKVPTETIIGVVFSASLAVGTLLTPEEELLEVLFGSIGSVSLPVALTGILAACAVVAFVLWFKDRLALSLVSADLARTNGLNVNRLNLMFLLLFVVTVILGLNFLGILLMGSLIIVPAAVSKNIARSLSGDLLISSCVSVVSVLLGLAAASALGTMVGPTIISVAALIFFLSLLVKSASPRA
jgi:ABC-type Mn2+/Zn2+ transport system permease subunit